MYNRYIPQPDGSYRRNRVHDNVSPAPRHSRMPRSQEPLPAHPPEADCSLPKQDARPQKPPEQHRNPKPPAGGVGDFLRQLLPKDFDIGDLIVVLLLLLMAGDCPEDQNTAMLTLALYLFM